MGAFGLDALSSVAYGPDEILYALLLAGSAGLAFDLPVAAAIAILLAIVAFSYRQTIYAYERGGLTPSLPQFLELVEFYVLVAPHPDGAKPEEDLRSQGVASVARALALEAYHVVPAQKLMARMQPKARRRG